MDRALRQRVLMRARGLCEYCLMPQAVAPLLFPIDHIIARQHRGTSTEDNLALCCGFCNLAKGPNIAGLDPATGELTRLFHARRDLWLTHFRFVGPAIVGVTDVGRTTLYVLDMNHAEQLAAREALIEAGMFHP